MLGLAAASCVVTIFAQTEAIQPFEHISLPLRMGNASISYVAYLGQMFWPSGLAVLYPFTAGAVGGFRKWCCHWFCWPAFPRVFLSCGGVPIF